jgi:hypothetical protein
MRDKNSMPTSSKLIWFRVVVINVEEFLVDFTKFYEFTNYMRGVALWKTDMPEFYLISAPAHWHDFTYNKFRDYGIIDFANVDYAAITYISGDQRAFDL